MMKKLIFVGGLALLLTSGCQKKNNEIVEKVAKLEERIALLEKRIAAQPPTAQQQQQPPAEQTAAYDLPVGKSYVWGDQNAPITLTKFSDFQCPFCARAHDSFVEKVFSDPALKGKVKIVFKHFPLSFHKAARPASKAALAAGEQGHDCFWEMTRKLYAGQKDLTDANYELWAKEVKCAKTPGAAPTPLDVKKFLSDYKSKDADYEKMITDDMALGTNTAQVRGTPSFFLNGWKLNQRSVEAVKQLIEEKGMLAGK